MFTIAISLTIIIYFFIFNIFFNIFFRRKNANEKIFANAIALGVYGVLAYTSLFAEAVAFFAGNPANQIISFLGDVPSFIKLMVLFVLGYFPILAATIFIVISLFISRDKIIK